MVFVPYPCTPLSVVMPWYSKINCLYSLYRTTTLSEELGQIQYIFSDKVTFFLITVGDPSEVKVCWIKNCHNWPLINFAHGCYCGDHCVDRTFVVSLCHGHELQLWCCRYIWYWQKLPKKKISPFFSHIYVE